MNYPNSEKIAFGPVPSRRLGRSLGINNIPHKTCTYSCIYCQLGRAGRIISRRQPFYKPEDIFSVVKRKVNEVFSKKERIDYLTFVPDGEPTLDVNLGKEISLLKHLKIPIAVITNASLLWQGEVKEDIMAADLVSLKVDAVSEDLWKRVNRPHHSLTLDAILGSIRDFSRSFKGTLVTETMLIDSLDCENELEGIANFLKSLSGLSKAYIAVPTRPPAEEWVRPAREEVMNAAFQMFSEKLREDRVEYLIGYEGNAFAPIGNAREDLLGILSVHPMREDAVVEYLRKADASLELIDDLLHRDEIVRLEYEGKIYYMRRLQEK